MENIAPNFYDKYPDNDKFDEPPKHDYNEKEIKKFIKKIRKHKKIFLKYE